MILYARAQRERRHYCNHRMNFVVSLKIHEYCGRNKKMKHIVHNRLRMYIIAYHNACASAYVRFVVDDDDNSGRSVRGRSYIKYLYTYVHDWMLGIYKNSFFLAFSLYTPTNLNSRLHWVCVTVLREKKTEKKTKSVIWYLMPRP